MGNQQQLRGAGTIPATAPGKLRVETSGRPIGVDRKNKIIRGYVVALAGPFKSDGRGEFDLHSLREIVRLWPSSSGLKSRFAHPNESSDGLGKFLGRAHRPWLGKARVQRGGKMVEVDAVRADLHLDESAFTVNPNGNLGEYLLTLAENDSDALSSSLVLNQKSEYRKDHNGRPALGADGEPLPPLWRPTELFASDVVDTGDAVDGFLSPTATGASMATRKPTAHYLVQGEALLNELFAGQDRATIERKLLAYLRRFLDRKFGTAPVPAPRGADPRTLSNLLDMKIRAKTEVCREIVNREMQRELRKGK